MSEDKNEWPEAFVISATVISFFILIGFICWLCTGVAKVINW